MQGVGHAEIRTPFLGWVSIYNKQRVESAGFMVYGSGFKVRALERTRVATGTRIWRNICKLSYMA